MSRPEVPDAPVFIETVDGDWLAVAPPLAAIHIGACGRDREEAGLRFNQARALLERCLRSASERTQAETQAPHR